MKDIGKKLLQSVGYSEPDEASIECRTQADAAADEQLRALWISMEQLWTKLAAHRERLQRLNAQVSNIARHSGTIG